MSQDKAVKIMPVNQLPAETRGRPPSEDYTKVVQIVENHYMAEGAFPVRLEGVRQEQAMYLRRSRAWKDFVKKYNNRFRLKISVYGVYVVVNLMDSPEGEQK